MKLFRLLLVFGCLIFTLSAQALTINVTYDSSVTTLTNAAQVEEAFGYAAQVFQSEYTNPITINISVYFSSSVTLGASSTSYYSGFSYADITNALRIARSSMADSNSFASLPPGNPTGLDQWNIPAAEAKALNIAGVDPSGADGQIGFASTVGYTFDSTNRSVSGKFDFIGVAEHEISEVLGRIRGLNSGIAGYMPFDLFRFTNNGARSFDVNATNVYFSVDNGLTKLKLFYTNLNSGDVQDWLSGTTPDAFDAFASSGHILPLSAADITALDVIGYNLRPLSIAHVTGTRLANGTFQITFTNIPSLPFTILTSTNLTLPVSNWAVLGNAIESPATQFRFIDSQTTTNKARFYRVSSP